MASPDRDLTLHHGRLVVDWPRSAGYFGGVGLAVVMGLVDPPLGLFIAAVPFLKMLNVGGAPRSLRLVAQFCEGMAKPVGGDGQGTIALAGPVPAAIRKPAERVDARARSVGRSTRANSRSRSGAPMRTSTRRVTKRNTES